MRTLLILAASAIVIWSCESGTQEDQYINDMGITLGNPIGTPLNESVVRDLTDELYPDNPDIESRSKNWNKYNHAKAIFSENEETHLFTLKFPPANEDSDTIIFENIDLMEWIPTAPEWIREDEYLTKVCMINQEWNRQQVRFDKGTFKMAGNGTEKDATVRVDLARNCLNSYLWEIISYTEEGGKQKSMFHGWFDFPHETYRKYFEKRTGYPFEKFGEHLKDWKDPEAEAINFDLLRTHISDVNMEWESHNDKYYELVGARKSKYKNIIYPENPSIIQDFLTDSTKFSTFYPPGCYSRNYPRPTMLGRMACITDLSVREASSPNGSDKNYLEFTLEFARTDNPEISTKFIVGGIDKSKIPTKSMSETHKGYKMPMGIANHAFYETYDEMLANRTAQNPFYAILLDENDKFIDSHLFGIDGPLFHWDENDSDLLHLWILSFERHAFVGHYTIDFSPEKLDLNQETL